ncbi:CGI-121-domain-containing protein [Auriscalpium vulgare]|uniref:CGI-121-domain-containing protein n=1 Tax=Auriscalpium vulgare TaxID=40419 RepID=A0ACB8S815_9AGAM|nr:CGI-121-domain-containing protein [Auriscalpium vulgare]
METFTYPHFPPEFSVVHVALFTDVKNAQSIRTRIVKASTLQGRDGDSEREAVNFAFVDARLVTSRLHLQTAIYQAILTETQASLRTKTVHSEILWALNPSNNITEAIRRYGVSDASTALLVVRIGPADLTDVEALMQVVVDGIVTPLEDLSRYTDWTAIKKYHKLKGDPAIIEAAQDVVREKEVIDNIVVSSVAIKSVTI